MEGKSKETFYCSFVSIHYIICECGETFPSEESLKDHLEKEHYSKNESKEANLQNVAKETQPNERKDIKIISKPKTSPAKEPKKIFIKKVKTEQLENYVYEMTQPDHNDIDTVEVEVKTENYEVHEPKHEVIYEMTENDEVQEPKEEVIYEMQEDPAEYADLETQEDQEYEEDQAFKEECGVSEDQDAVVTLLENHLQEEHRYNAQIIQDDLFYCELCGRGFPSQKIVTAHINRIHLKKRIVKIEEPERRHKTHFCELCDKTFFSKKGVTLHKMRLHTTEAEKIEASLRRKKVVCEVCGRKYASNAALSYHQRVHTGEKPYECTICNRRFTMPLFLQIHMRIHTGERPYGCPHCPKAFSNKAALLRHDRVHSGLRPYTCPECNKSFTQSNSMKLHVRTVHLKLPAPYKSKARRLKALLRTNGDVDQVSQKVKLYTVDSRRSTQYTEQLAGNSDDETNSYTEEYDTETQ